MNMKAIQLDMVGVVAEPEESLVMDEWIEFLKETLLRLAGVEVPTRMVLEVVSPVVPLSLDTTRANALHLLRSSLCCKLVGPSLVVQVNRLILREVAQVPVKLFSDA